MSIPDVFLQGYWPWPLHLGLFIYGRQQASSSYADRICFKAFRVSSAIRMVFPRETLIGALNILPLTFWRKLKSHQCFIASIISKIAFPETIQQSFYFIVIAIFELLPIEIVIPKAFSSEAVGSVFPISLLMGSRQISKADICSFRPSSQNISCN